MKVIDQTGTILAGTDERQLATSREPIQLLSLTFDLVRFRPPLNERYSFLAKLWSFTIYIITNNCILKFLWL